VAGFGRAIHAASTDNKTGMLPTSAGMTRTASIDPGKAEWNDRQYRNDDGIR